MSSITSVAALNDNALLSQFSELVRQDREGKANLLRHIDAIDSRKLWARLGRPSLFDFLVTRHHMSEATAFKRIGAARTARRFPLLFAMVARGELHLSGIHRIKAHLTQENHEQVLAAAKHKTIRQIEELVAHFAPQPDAPSTLRALPNRAPTAQALAATAPAAPLFAAPSLAASTPSLVPVAPTAPVPLAPRRDPDPTPLSPGRWKLQVTLGQRSRDKLKQLQDLLAHKIPNGDPAAIVERALDALLNQVHKRKTGATAKPRALKSKRESKSKRAAQRTRHVELPCAAKSGRATTVAVVLSAKTGTAATRHAACSSLTSILGAREVRTPPGTSGCVVRRITPSKPIATTERASWPVSASRSRSRNR